MPSLRLQWRGVRILHTALMASVAIYGVVVFVAVRGQPPLAKPPFPPAILLAILGGMALVNLLAVIPLIAMRKMPPRDRGAGAVDLDDATLAQHLNPQMMKVRQALILTWALCESVAIFGLIGAFLSREMIYFVPFGVVALAALAFYAPTTAMLESIARGATKH